MDQVTRFAALSFSFLSKSWNFVGFTRFVLEKVGSWKMAPCAPGICPSWQGSQPLLATALLAIDASPQLAGSYLSAGNREQYELSYWGGKFSWAVEVLEETCCPCAYYLCVCQWLFVRWVDVLHFVLIKMQVGTLWSIMLWMWWLKW